MPARQADTAGRWVDDSRVVAVLDHGKQLYTAVQSRWGPHVTPQVFERKGRRLWIVVPRRSVKAHAIAVDRAIGGLVLDSGGRSVVFTARASTVDPLTLRGLDSRSRLLDLPVAMTGYLERNRRHAVGVVRDRPVPTLALSRVVVAIDLTAVALLEGLSVVAAWGDWKRRDLLLRGGPPPSRPPPLDAMPSEVRTLAETPTGSAALGWHTLSGLVALPALGDVATGAVSTSIDAMVLAGAPSRSPSCLTVDRGRSRLDSKHGLLIRGQGQARADEAAVHVAVSPDRLTYWVGDRSGTVRARPDGR